MLRRTRDLEDNLRQSYALVRQYEELLRLSGDPREQARCRFELRRLWALIGEHLAEYRQLVAETPLPGEIEEIAAAASHWQSTQPAAAGAEAGTGTPPPPRRRPRIFLSYRQADSAGHAGRLRDRLAAAFGEGNVFLDVASQGPGSEFPVAVKAAVEGSDVLLALIGPRWLEAADPAGRRRLEDPSDLVRQEILLALERRLLVIPVLLDGVAVPKAEDLPAHLQPLLRHTAISLRHDSFERDAEALIRALERVVVA